MNSTKNQNPDPDVGPMNFDMRRDLYRLAAEIWGVSPHEAARNTQASLSAHLAFLRLMTPEMLAIYGRFGTFLRNYPESADTEGEWENLVAEFERYIKERKKRK